jgi:hypothetical protein
VIKIRVKMMVRDVEDYRHNGYGWYVVQRVGGYVVYRVVVVGGRGKLRFVRVQGGFGIW